MGMQGDFAAEFERNRIAGLLRKRAAELEQMGLDVTCNDWGNASSACYYYAQSELRTE